MISCSTSSNNCLLIVSLQNYYTVSMASVSTVEPLFNESLFNEVLDVTNDILHPGQIYSKMYGIEPWYNEPRFNEFFDITNIIRKPKRKIYLDTTNSNASMLNIQHTTVEKRWIDQQSANPLILMVKFKGQKPFSQRLITCHRHWHYSISTEVTCVVNQSLTKSRFHCMVLLWPVYCNLVSLQRM